MSAIVSKAPLILLYKFGGVFFMEFKGIRENIGNYFLFLLFMIWALFAIMLVVDGVGVYKNTKEKATKKVYTVDDFDEKQNLIIANGVAINKVKSVKMIQGVDGTRNGYYISSDRVFYINTSLTLVILKSFAWIISSFVILGVLLLSKRKKIWVLLFSEVCLGIYLLVYWLYMGVFIYIQLALMSVLVLAYLFFRLRRGSVLK